MINIKIVLSERKDELFQSLWAQEGWGGHDGWEALGSLRVIIHEVQKGKLNHKLTLAVSFTLHLYITV